MSAPGHDDGCPYDPTKSNAECCCSPWKQPTGPTVRHFMDGVRGGEVRGCTCGFKCDTPDAWSEHFRDVMGNDQAAHDAERAALKPSVDFVMGTNLPDCLLDAQERAARSERRVPRFDFSDSNPKMSNISISLVDKELAPEGCYIEHVCDSRCNSAMRTHHGLDDKHREIIEGLPIAAQPALLGVKPAHKAEVSHGVAMETLIAEHQQQLVRLGARCDECDPSFSCFATGELCRKVPITDANIRYVDDLQLREGSHYVEPERPMELPNIRWSSEMGTGHIAGPYEDIEQNIPVALSDIDSKPITKPHKTPMATCPCCTQPMIWDESMGPKPNPFDWCDECRGALTQLATGTDDTSRAFRQQMLSNHLCNFILAKSI